MNEELICKLDKNHHNKCVFEPHGSAFVMLICGKTKLRTADKGTKRKYFEGEIFMNEESVETVKIRIDCEDCYNSGYNKHGEPLWFTECQDCKLYVCENHLTLEHKQCKEEC